ncbi:unnamed protein product, partial [Adineta steineri]
MTSSATHPRFQIQRSPNEINTNISNGLPSVKPPREVTIRVKFIRLGEVITLQEKFFAEIVIEARWLYDRSAASWNPNL